MRPIVFMGHTLQVIRGFPDQIKVEVGYELDKVQRGEHPRQLLKEDTETILRAFRELT